MTWLRLKYTEIIYENVSILFQTMVQQYKTFIVNYHMPTIYIYLVWSLIKK